MIQKHFKPELTVLNRFFYGPYKLDNTIQETEQWVLLYQNNTIHIVWNLVALKKDKIVQN